MQIYIIQLIACDAYYVHVYYTGIQIVYTELLPFDTYPPFAKVLSEEENIILMDVFMSGKRIIEL